MLGRGTVLGERYTLTERLGGGAMGEVWRADDRVFERQVAVKILHPGLLDDDTFAARFRREARLLATLSHPAIVNVHDYGESHGEDETETETETDNANETEDDDSGVRVAYIVMELIDGTPLDEVLSERGPLPAEEALGIIAQALEGLHAAHLREIVHRDIKPANLMLRSDGRVTVTDFGIARTPSGTKLTDTHSVIGTALYMSPEHAEGLGAVPASDLYSMGVVCYQLLTGELPFTGETVVQVLMKQIREPAPELPDTFTEPVRAFVARALAKEPEARYADAAAMAEAARRAAAGQPIGPAPVPAPKPAPASPPPADDTIVLAAKRKQKQSESEKQKQKRRRIPTVLLLPLVITLGGGTIWYMDPLPDRGSESDTPQAGETASGGQNPDVSDPGSASPDASDEPDREHDPSHSPSGAPSDDEKEEADSDNAGQDGSGGSGSSGGDSGGTSGDDGGSTSSGSGSGGGGGGGGSDDPPPSGNDPDPSADRPESCGGDGWGHITNVGNGLRLGLNTDTPQADSKVVMGGNDAYGWVRSSFYGQNSFYACNLSSPLLSYNNADGGVVLSTGVAYWEIDTSAPSDASYLKVAYSGPLQCLTSNGAGKQVTVTTCTPGNESQMWRLP